MHVVPSWVGSDILTVGKDPPSDGRSSYHLLHPSFLILSTYSPHMQCFSYSSLYTTHRVTVPACPTASPEREEREARAAVLRDLREADPPREARGIA